MYERVRGHVAQTTRQEIEAKTRYLYGLLIQSYLGMRRHDAPTSVRELGATYFSSRILRRHLGGAHRDPKTGKPSYQNYLEPFWTFEVEGGGYSKEQGETKRYILHNKTVSHITEELLDDSPAITVDVDTGMVLTAAVFPANGVYRSSYSHIQIRSLIDLDPAILHNEMRELEARVAATPAFVRFHPERPLRTLYFVHKWVATLGGLPNLYRDYDEIPSDGHGRLYGQGHVHPQFLPGDVRRVVFQGMGLWDYDFQSCHLSLLRSIGAASGGSTEIIADYLENKAAIHLRLTDLLSVDEDRVKSVLLALLNGAEPVANEHLAICRILGITATRALAADAWVTAFRMELLSLTLAVLEHSKLHGPEPWRPDGFFNVVRKFQPFIESRPDGGGTKQVKPELLLHHLLEGYEAWCLDLVCRGYQDTTVLIFDGWISPKRDYHALEQLIGAESRKQFGFELAMRLKEEAIL